VKIPFLSMNYILNKIFILLVCFFGFQTFANIPFSDKFPKPNNQKQLDKADGIQFFEGSFKEALEKAQKENKMVFIDSYTNWCGPCKTMKNIYLKEEKLVKFLNENFVCLSVNIEKGEGPSIKRRYPHGTYPSLLFIRANGKLKNKFLGLPDYGATELLNFSKMSYQTQ
jgi:thioredoxin 1